MNEITKKEIGDVLNVGFGLFVTIGCLMAWGILVAMFLNYNLGMMLIILMIISFISTYIYRLNELRLKTKTLQDRNISLE